MKFIGKLIIYGLALIGGLTVLGGALALGVLFMLSEDEPGTGGNKGILYLDLAQGLSEAPDPWAQMVGQGAPALGDVLQALDDAGTDRDVKALAVRIGGAPLGMAMVQELRGALDKFRASGKPALGFSDDLSGPGATAAYLLATGFDEFWLQPSGNLELTGFAIESPFFKDALDKMAITPRLSRRHEYKSAAESVMRDGFSDPARENLGAVLASLMDQAVQRISNARQLSTSQVRALIDRGPFLATEALAERLVDRLGYRDEWLAALKERSGQADLVSLASYAESSPKKKGKGLAVIYASGAVHRGQSGTGGLMQGVSIGADTVIRQLKDAADDPDVAAIVLRVNSPGGDYVAADAIWRQVTLAKKSKPVIASMGDVAASGGYYMVMGADRIVAQPGALTGSIGVFAGKFVLKDFWGKLGINWDRVATGANAGMWSFNRDFTPEQAAHFERILDAIYDDFAGKAAASRNMTPEEMDKAARGRVFTGAEAQKAGLVDELGGLNTALRLAKEHAGLSPTEPTRIIPYPKTPEWVGMLSRLTDGQGVPGLSLRLPPPLLAALYNTLTPAGPLQAPDLTVQ